jgi:hypothetical protein
MLGESPWRSADLASRRDDGELVVAVDAAACGLEAAHQVDVL